MTLSIIAFCISLIAFGYSLVTLIREVLFKKKLEKERKKFNIIFGDVDDDEIEMQKMIAVIHSDRSITLEPVKKSGTITI